MSIRKSFQNGKACLKRFFCAVFCNKIIYREGEIQTSKTNSYEHGIGIKNIIETIKKYGGSYVIQNDEQEFYFSIVIPLRKNNISV